jgi:hypothetical protein
MSIHLLAQSLRKRHRRIQDSSRQDEQEFLAPIASDAVYLPCLVLEELGKLLEHRISCLVPVVVVHALELVDVAHDDCHRLMESDRVAPHLLETVLE